ncbi:cysteine-rich protein 2-binding protein [Chelonus insularis]|uniref:cysteine-rich protein 2-binding protein n=1 Tax=Chelonus insularis TaxID=460826 RepID=UPI00158F500A|nr:cysteine-rich protein 2-binding protein [Chelonus insularis]
MSEINVKIEVKSENEEGDNEEEEKEENYLCKYCGDPCDPYIRPALLCSGECVQKIHVRCLKRGGVPGALVGDVFFELYCTECSPLKTEIINRGKLSWLNIIVLTLYNLKEKSSGISKRGYFHWKSDISTFVDKNWDHLFQKTVKRKKNWIGTISGTLSHYSTTFFKSGTTELGESGWWRLVDNDPPEILMNKNNKIIMERKKQSLGQNKIILNPVKVANSPSRSESSMSFGEDNYPSVDPSTANLTPSMFSREYVQPTEILSDFLLADDDVPDIDLLDIDDGLDFNEQPDSISPVDLVKDLDKFNSFSKDNPQISQLLNTFNPEWMNNILSQENFDESGGEKDKFGDAEEQYEEETSNDSCIQEPIISLFRIKNKRDWPWMKPERTSEQKKPKMGRNEEDYIIQSINKAHIDSMTPSLRRLYRKLVVRKLKRSNNVPLFDIDTFGIKPESRMNFNDESHRVIDRFYNINFSAIFEQRLSGTVEPTAVHSPYTNRILKPFIRRDYSCQPLWLKLMQELTAKVNKNNPDWKPEDPTSIDYCYVRPQHIPAVNNLCSQYFWPGIDLTDCLQYPDFTCVVLYKKLVIGFAVLVPDVNYNEAYISFLLTRSEWRKSGIGTFMLYHLIQTCMGKDVTLHVSVTNPALILYQKFGFKIEEFVQDFYDKYMACGVRESRHALFLRLSR